MRWSLSSKGGVYTRLISVNPIEYKCSYSVSRDIQYKIVKPNNGKSGRHSAASHSLRLRQLSNQRSKHFKMTN